MKRALLPTPGECASPLIDRTKCGALSPFCDTKPRANRYRKKCFALRCFLASVTLRYILRDRQLSMASKDRYREQIDRLVSSPTLHSSESLCRLLQYLANHALQHPTAPLKEYQIATEVFGRPSDFDSQTDSTIRVQASRLRMKLAEYYKSEGSADSILVELPKGTYILSFQQRPAREHAESQVGESASGNSVHGRWIALLATLLVGAFVAIGVMAANRKPAQTVLARNHRRPPAAFQAFWKPFVSGTEEPWVIFSNAAFVGRPETGMRYYNAQHDTHENIWDHYTGVGEVLAVHSLDQVFGTFERQLRVKRGSLFSLDDAKHNDLIFLGSPSENLTLTELPSTHEFVFQRLSTGPRTGDLAILNQHPRSGEGNLFLATASSPLMEDYAVIAFLHGLTGERSVLILAGTTTFGTQAAAEYVSREDSVEELLARLTGSSTGGIVPFEAVIHVKVARGVPVETELAALRRL